MIQRILESAEFTSANPTHVNTLIQVNAVDNPDFETQIKKLVEQETKNLKNSTTDTDVLKDYALISHPVLHLYPVVVPSEGDIVKGVVFEVSEMELERLDRYETEYYKRENVTLDSGVECMVYVQNKDVDKE